MKPVKAAVSLRNFKRKLKVGDPVAVISGPLSNRPLEERVGKILNFEVRKGKLLVRVGGINVRRKLIRARRPGEENRFVETEFPIAYSNVMFYSESLKRPVRLKYKIKDGEKKRGFIHPETREFVSID